MGNTVLDSTRLDSTINEHGIEVLHVVCIIHTLVTVTVYRCVCMILTVAVYKGMHIYYRQYIEVCTSIYTTDSI